MSDFFPLYVYFGLVGGITLLMLCLTVLFPSVQNTKTKYLPYESGIQTETHLLKERFPLRHYLVALIFLVFDIEVIFLYPWATVAKQIGPFALYEMGFFILALLLGFGYVLKKQGLKWE